MRLFGASFILVCGFLPAAMAGEDWQLWLDQAVGLDVSEKSSVRVNQSFRFSDDSGQLETYYLEGGYAWTPRMWLELAMFYRQQYQKKDDRWREENRPHANVTLKWKVKSVTISDRSRFEYRFREAADDTFRYRNKLTLQYSGNVLGFNLKPYVAAEGFVDESANLRDRDQTRFTVGIRTDPDEHLLKHAEHRFNRRLVMDYYLTEQKTKKDEDWVDEHIAGVQVGVFF